MFHNYFYKYVGAVYNLLAGRVTVSDFGAKFRASFFIFVHANIDGRA